MMIIFEKNMDQGTMSITSLKVRNRLLCKAELFYLPRFYNFLNNVPFSAIAVI